MTTTDHRPAYQPPSELLDRYADALVGYGLGHGDGIKTGDVVAVFAPEDARPLFSALHQAVWRAGGHVIPFFLPAADGRFNERRALLEHGTDAQIDFFPAAYRRGLVDTADHLIDIDCVRDPQAMTGADPQRLLRLATAAQRGRRWFDEKEAEGRFTWVVGAYGTAGMAREAGLTLEQYWEQIIIGCQLHDPDPVARWRQIDARLQRTARWLTDLSIDRLHIAGADADLWVTVGEGRRWIGGGGANVPTYEVFTSPDWRGTEGWIRFDRPLYAFGSLVRGIRLEFENGIAAGAHADENEPLLTQLLATPNGNRIGEFSLTDGRLSPIDRFMALTLFDENTGGRYGNTHIAIGDAYADTFSEGPAALTDALRAQLGFNEAPVHEDLVSTTDRTVTATLRDGTATVIYADGRFTLD